MSTVLIVDALGRPITVGTPGADGRVIERPDPYRAINAQAKYASGAPPKIDFSVTPVSIQLGDSALLEWRVSGATQLEAFGAWAGLKDFQGSLQVVPLFAGTYRFTLVANSVRNEIAATVTLAVHDPSAAYFKIDDEHYLLIDGDDSRLRIQ